MGQTKWASIGKSTTTKIGARCCRLNSRLVYKSFRHILWFSGKRHHVNLRTESDIKGNNGDVSAAFICNSSHYLWIRDSLKDQQKVPLAHNYRRRRSTGWAVANIGEHLYYSTKSPFIREMDLACCSKYFPAKCKFGVVLFHLWVAQLGIMAYKHVRHVCQMET